MSIYDGPHLNLYDSVLDQMLNSKSGEVGRYMRTVGLKIVVGAKSMVNVRTGNLRRSIHLRAHDRWTRGQFVEVAAETSYAHMVHEGARPHLIASTGGRVLAFKSHGQMHFARSVSHPGFRGRNYLTIPMRRAVGR